MKRLERSTLLAVVLLPLLFCGLGGWQIVRGAATAAEYAAAAGSDAEVAWLRQAAAWLTLGAAGAVGVAGLAGLRLVDASARRGMRDRPTLVAAFGRVGRFLPAALAVQVVGAVLALAAAVTFEVSGLWFVPDPDGRTVLLAFLVIVYAGLALWGGIGTLRNLRRALRLFEPVPLPLSAVALTPAQAPGLFALLDELARERGTTPPETVAAGAEDGFFVTAFPRALVSGPGSRPIVTRGRILHLPMPTMATLDAAELRTVLAHELAHFSGEDTAYSTRFAPLFAGLGQGAAAMSVRDRAFWGSTRFDRVVERAVHPQTALAVHALDRFSQVVAHWSRLRELEADRAAIAAGSPEALASSLLRVGLASEIARAERAALAAQPDDAPPDLAAATVARMAAAGDPAAHLGDHMPHPTDSHPPTWQRIDAAGVAVDAALMARAARPVDPADLAAVQALFLDWDAVSGEITGHLRDEARRWHEAHRAGLREAAGAGVGRGETALYAAALRPAIALLLLGVFCAAVAATCVGAALYGGAQDREAWRLLFGIAAAGVVGLGFVALWSVRLSRGRAQPYLVLDEDGFRSPGLAAAVRWLDVQTVAVFAGAFPTTQFVLRPGVALPGRTGRVRRLQLDRKKHAVQFVGMLPRGMGAAALQALLLRQARAAHARQALEPSGAAQP